VPEEVLSSALQHWSDDDDGRHSRKRHVIMTEAGPSSPAGSIKAPWLAGAGGVKNVSSSVDSSTLAREEEDSFLEHLTVRWCNRRVSNFEYLMALNEAAGRKMGDSTYHPVLPWISDFQRQGGGWRDFSKSKFRLKKGDKQLDETYSFQQPPHHITENLSDITYYTYMSRRTPVQVLKQIVRPKFEPQEYPQNMAGMYDFSPDECIPEFFVDPHSFTSLHEGLSLNLNLKPQTLNLKP
jgi:hypothetical protein